MFQNWKALSFNGGVEKMTPREKEKKGAVEKKRWEKQVSLGYLYYYFLQILKHFANKMLIIESKIPIIKCIELKIEILAYIFRTQNYLSPGIFKIFLWSLFKKI